MNELKKILISAGVKNLYKTLKLSDHYLKEVGWNLSVKKTASIDKYGDPIPWFTYPCIQFLDSRLNDQFSLFEFGSGNSTFWFGTKLGSVYSVEHDIKWFEKLNNILQNSPNINYSYKDIFNGDYQSEILKYENFFDIVVIDGRDRVKCCYNSIGSLKNSGVIIWDNSERERYAEAYDFLSEREFKRIDFWGLGPINHQEWCTSIFYRQNNCLGI